MSTRTRIILKQKELVVARGVDALDVCCAKVFPDRIRRKSFLQSVPGVTKKEKITYLAERLPLGWSIVLLQEPRRTRKNKSLYWKDTL